MTQEAPRGDTTLNGHELAECLLRCAEAKYAEVEGMAPAARLNALLDNLAGAATEQQVIVAATAIAAPRRHMPSADGNELPLLDGEDVRDRAEAVRVWAALRLGAIPGYPLWEPPVFAMLRAAQAGARAIFDAYASAYKRGTFATEARARTMDADEWMTFVREAYLLSDKVGEDAAAAAFEGCHRDRRLAQARGGGREAGGGGGGGDNGGGDGCRRRCGRPRGARRGAARTAGGAGGGEAGVCAAAAARRRDGVRGFVQALVGFSFACQPGVRCRRRAGAGVGAA